eukprot:900759-Ditylum_brightwellii.AAC.1
MVPYYGMMELNKRFLVLLSINSEDNTSDQTQYWEAIQKSGVTVTRKDCKREKLRKEDTEAKKSP